jgi:hypothetical protein
MIILIGSITITAIVRYQTVDDAMRFWSGLSGVVGVVTGVIATYFFTRQSVNQAHQQASEARLSAATERQRSLAAHQALTKLAGRMQPEDWQLLENDPVIKNAIEPVPSRR